MEILGMIIFWFFLIAGVVIIPFGVAGTFIIVADAFIYGLATRFERITLSFIGLLLAMALAVELVESFLGALLAKKFGGSKWGMTGAIFGGFLGAVIGTTITPALGTLLGGFIGAFIGALSLEGMHSSDWHNALKVGIGAFLGALGGKVIKIIVAIVMVVMVIIRIF